MQKQPHKKQLKTNILSGAIFLALSASITLGNYYIERQSSLAKSPETTQELIFKEVKGSVEAKPTKSSNWQKQEPASKLNTGDHIRTGQNSQTEIELINQTVLRLNENSEVKIFYTQNPDPQIIIQAIKGSIWLNSQYSSTPININSKGLTLIPHNSIIQAEYDQSQVKILNHLEETTIAFTDPTKTQTKILTRQDHSDFINSFLLVDGSQTTIFTEKISQQLAPLLYSKLVKEFNYSQINTSQLNESTWFKNNQEKDKQLKQATISNLINKINKRGLQNAEVKTQETIIDQTSKIFTLSPKKETQRTLNQALSELSDAEFLLLNNQKAQATLRLKEFQKSTKELLGSPNLTEKLQSKLSEKYNELKIIDPTHVLYPAKETIFNIHYSQTLNSEDPLQAALLLRSQLHEAFRNVEIDINLAIGLFETYSQNLEKFLNRYPGQLEPIEFILAEENQIIGQIIRQQPKLYRDDIFAIKSTLEKTWLNLLPAGEELLEEQQTLILQKINLLTRLRYFFFQEKIPVEDAKDVVLRLTQEIQTYQNPQSQTAVQQIFQTELEDFNTFWRYLNSPQYASPTASKRHGATHEERYEKFLEAISQSNEINDITANILEDTTDETSKKSIEEITKKIQSDLEKAQLTDIEFKAPTTTTQTRITLNQARINDEVISGNYDWNRQILYNIKVNNEEFASAGIKIQNLINIINPTTELAPTTTTEPTEQTNTTQSKLEKTAKTLIRQKLNENNLEVTLDQIAIISLEEAKFLISRLLINSNPKILASFEYNSKTNTVSRLNLETQQGITNLNGEVNLSNTDLKELITSQINEILTPREEPKAAAEETIESEPESEPQPETNTPTENPTNTETTPEQPESTQEPTPPGLDPSFAEQYGL